jgi:MFS family permease
MAIDIIVNYRFCLSNAGPSVAGMTTHMAQTRRLPRLIWALAACHFVSRAGGFVQTFLLLYLTQERQFTPHAAGAVVSAVGGGTVGSLLLGGWLSDRVGRRTTMLAGFLGTAAAVVMLGSADSAAAIWVAAVGVGLSSELFRPAGSATVADLPSAGERVRGFGLVFWASNLGFSVSTVAAGVLVEHGYGLLFWLNAAVAVASALIVWRHVPETGPPERARRRALLPVLVRDRLMIAMALVFVAYFALFSQAFSALPLAMAADGLGAATYGAALAVNGIAILALQPVAVRLLAGRDPGAVLSASMLTVGLGLGMGAVAHGGVGYAATVLVWTAGEIGVAVVFGAVFADLAPADLRGGYLGVATTTWAVGGVLGPLAGTAMLDGVGPAALWVGCAVAGVVLGAVQRALGPALRRRSHEED